MSNDQTNAERIVKQLFQNGFGDKAVRLVMLDEKGRDIGGWCRDAVLDLIRDQQDDDEKCEGCNAPATTFDPEGVPLCRECAEE